MKKTTTILVFLTLLILFILNLFYIDPENSDGLVQNKSTIPSIPVPEVLSITNKQVISEQELENIETETSEHNGKWAGLCTKNSINSNNVDDPVTAFRNTVMGDPVLVQHFVGFMWSKAAVTTLAAITSNNQVNVTHRSGSIIKPSKKEIKLKGTEEIITDGYRAVRTFCCNDVLIKTPLTPLTPLTPSVQPPSKKIEAPPVYIIMPRTDPEPFASIVKDVPSELSINTYGRGVRHITTYIDKPTSSPPTAPVPEPATLLLFGSGLSILAFLKRKK